MRGVGIVSVAIDNIDTEGGAGESRGGLLYKKMCWDENVWIPGLAKLWAEMVM